MRNMARQIQALIAALDDAKFTNKDIYLTYIDFKNTFGSIDHPRLLAIVEDLGDPLDAIDLVGNVYDESTTSFKSTHFSNLPSLSSSHQTPFPPFHTP